MKKEEIAKDNFEEDSYDDYDLGIENYNGQNGYLFNKKDSKNKYNDKKKFQNTKYIQTENYPEFGTYFNTFDKNEKCEKKLFIPFSRYSENFPKFNYNCCICYIYHSNHIFDFPCFNIVIKFRDVKFVTDGLNLAS